LQVLLNPHVNKTQDYQMYLTPILQVRLLLIPNLDLKVDKITGKGLSTEDYTTAED
jgi:hypothetical protein